MHVLNLIQCTELGGMEQATMRVLAGLQARGHTCTVVSTNPVGALGPLLASQRVPAVGVPFRGRGGWRSHPRLRAVVRSAAAKADAVLMTGPTVTGMLALRARDRRRQVLAVHYHHTGVKRPLSWRGIYTLAMNRFGAITFPSDFIRHEAEALCPGLRRLALTVRNPLPLPALADDASRRAARTALGLPAGAPVVGNAGWLIPRKRFDVFLRVAARVRAAVPEAVFVIAGDGPERAALEALARELGIGAAVRWLGWQRDLNPVYRALDVLLFNSDWDAFPTTPLEAMSHAVPVVASSIHGGLGETIADRRVGVLMRTHDEESLAEAAVALLRDPPAARRVGAAGRERVARQCEPAAVVTAYERLLTGEPPAAVRSALASDGCDERGSPSRE
jgi:glycosyltransferase involved in cell wall biosynthesis